MAVIQVDGERYRVAENLGYVPDIGMYAKIVDTPTGERKAVKHRGSGVWRFWSAADRTAPLREAVARGWPRKERE